MQSCISSNCSIMSRGKSRASVDTCGDCGLQGLPEKLRIQWKFAKNCLLFICRCPICVTQSRWVNPVVQSEMSILREKTLDLSPFRYSALLWLCFNSPFARLACDDRKSAPSRLMESIGAQLHQSNQCSRCQFGVGTRPTRSQLQATEASAKSER